MSNKLYTAVGRTQIKNSANGKRFPAVILNDKEYILDLQEMIMWSVLNWRILTAAEICTLCDVKEKEVGYVSFKSVENCLHRLVQRGLVAEGIGTTEADALYDLLSELYIIPISENIILRIVSFSRLTLFNGVPFSVAKRIFGKDKRSDDEKKVMHLARQALLSTVEIIKCVEYDSFNFENEQELLDTLYSDELTTCDNLVESARNFKNCRLVLTSVANLLLRRQIILDRL